MPIAIPLVVGLMLSACSSPKGICSNQTGTGITTLASSVTENECRGLCQDLLQRDDCDWVEIGAAARVVGPFALRMPFDHSAG